MPLYSLTLPMQKERVTKSLQRVGHIFRKDYLHAVTEEQAVRESDMYPCHANNSSGAFVFFSQMDRILGSRKWWRAH